MMLPSLTKECQKGPVRELNPGPLAPLARIMPLDQQAKRGLYLFDEGLNLLSLLNWYYNTSYVLSH